MNIQQPQIDNAILGYTTIVTTGSTTTLTVYSNYVQRFTGTLNQTIQLPIVSGLTLNQGWEIINDSTGILTINSSGGNLIAYCMGNSRIIINCISLSGTNSNSWSYSMISNKQLNISSVTLTSNTVIGSTYNYFISNGVNLTHTLPDPTIYPNMEWTITNINSSDVNLIGTLHGDVNPVLYYTETFNFFSDGNNLYIK